MSRMGNPVVMPESNRERRMIGQPIIEIEANKEIMDTHIYLDKEIFQIRRKEEKSIICMKCLQFRYLKKYHSREEEYCVKFKGP